MTQSSGVIPGSETDLDMVDLRALCQTVMNEARGIATEQSVLLEEAHFAGEVFVDAVALRKVLSILVRAEILRTERGSTLTLLTTPRRHSTEIRIIGWRTPTADAAPVQERDGSAPRASRDSGFVERRGRRMLDASGGSIWIDEGPVARTVCLRLPNHRAGVEEDALEQNAQ